MLEIYNEHGYAMWKINSDRIERQCLLYRNGVEIDPQEDEAEDIVEHFRNFVLEKLPLENRSVYIQNMPIWLCKKK